MEDTSTPAGFTELDGQFISSQESIRDQVANLLADALHGCEEDQRAGHVERAFMIYERLETMHGILWKVLRLVDPKGSNADGVGEKATGRG